MLPKDADSCILFSQAGRGQEGQEPYPKALAGDTTKGLCEKLYFDKGWHYSYLNIIAGRNEFIRGAQFAHYWSSARFYFHAHHAILKQHITDRVHLQCGVTGGSTPSNEALGVFVAVAFPQHLSRSAEQIWQQLRITLTLTIGEKNSYQGRWRHQRS